VSATRALARRTLADSRARNVSFALLFAFVAYVNVVGYRTTYPTVMDRLGFARAFGGNASLRLFYGEPFDLLSVGGYAAWRIGGLMSIFAAMWGALAAVRALRGEEDSGRQELVLAGRLSRVDAFAARLAATFAGMALLWLAIILGLLAARMPAGESAYLALAIVSVVPVFVGVGALASQLAATRRVALELSSAVLAVALVLRVAADTAAGLAWLRWSTPLGWVEEMRPFAGPRPAVLLAPLAAAALLLALAGRIAAGRDVGRGLLATRERAEARPGLLSSPTSFALRDERGSLIGWLIGSGAFALIIGSVSTSVTSASVPANLERQLRKVAAISITTPAGYIGLCFLFFILIVSLFCCSQIAAARHEESQGRLETLLSLPVARERWLAGRLVLAAAGAAAISLGVGLLAWAGASAQGAGIPLSSMLEAAANCLPAALAFLGLAALAFAAVPRAAAGLAYGVVAVAFVWQLFGGLLGAPHWLLDVSPFAHIGLVPAQPLRGGGAIAMLAVGALAGACALWRFRRRDLIGD